MGARSGGAGTPATRALAVAGLPHVLRAHPHEPDEPTSAGSVREQLGVPARRVMATLVVRVDGSPVLAVLAVNRTPNLPAIAAAVGGTQAEIASPMAAERATGYPRTGICPIATRVPLPTVLDNPAIRESTILISGGRPGLDIELDPHDLIRATNARVAPIGRLKRS